MTQRKDGGDIEPAPDIESVVEEKGRTARKAAAVKSRTKALARRLRKGSRMASLTADISTGIETIAGLADRIAETFGSAGQKLADVSVWNKEKADQLRALSDILGEVRGEADELVAEAGDVSLDFARVSGMLRDIHASVQESAEVHSRVLKTAQDLAALDAHADELVERTERLAERAELAVVNAALEAGRAGRDGAEFALLAEAAQKFSSNLTAGADECVASAKAATAAHRVILEKAGETSERIRAVGVVTKGARNAFSEGGDAVATLCGTAGELSSAIDNLRAAALDLTGDNPHGVDAASRARESIRHALSLAEEQEIHFAGAADQAERLLSTAGALAASGDIVAALDDVYTETDSFIRSIETTLERLDLALLAARDAQNETDRVRRDPDAGEEGIGGLAELASGSEAASARFAELAAKIARGLVDTAGALKTVASDLGALAADGEGIGPEIARTGESYRNIGHFIDILNGFSARMDLVAVEAGIFAFRAGAEKVGIGSYPPEFEAVASEAAGLVRLWREYLSRCNVLAASLPAGNARVSWKDAEGVFSGLLTGIDELSGAQFDGLLKLNAALGERIAAQGLKIAKIRSRSGDAAKTAGEAHALVSEAAARCEDQKAAFHEITASAEKISSLADELYPDEE